LFCFALPQDLSLLEHQASQLMREAMDAAALSTAGGAGVACKGAATHSSVGTQAAMRSSRKNNTGGHQGAAIGALSR